MVSSPRSGICCTCYRSCKRGYWERLHKNYSNASNCCCSPQVKQPGICVVKPSPCSKCIYRRCSAITYECAPNVQTRHLIYIHWKKQKRDGVLQPVMHGLQKCADLHEALVQIRGALLWHTPPVRPPEGAAIVGPLILGHTAPPLCHQLVLHTSRCFFGLKYSFPLCFLFFLCVYIRLFVCTVEAYT